MQERRKPPWSSTIALKFGFFSWGRNNMFGCMGETSQYDMGYRGIFVILSS